ncbi:hypothetical protein CKAN_01673700 [Cinnamomum micranthum f. kanehirae]|uniref:Uncharacterized protein n=1 Tax=Cinnamomum micranthum f. kanehirae TaxID=337451 RepID=A0A443PAM5_9MAGN|nr:hypothetical protein CKAN_01673700 [Cinnamomum micranthum f. kanehirae]
MALGVVIASVNIDFAHKHLFRSQGLDSMERLGGFRFKVISDGLWVSWADERGRKGLVDSWRSLLEEHFLGSKSSA